MTTISSKNKLQIKFHIELSIKRLFILYKNCNYEVNDDVTFR